MAVDLAVEARERGIKYFLISYVDLFGTLRAKLAPAAAIGDMAKDGAGFAGFASWLDMTPRRSRRARHSRRIEPDPAPLEARGRLARRRPLHERQAGRAGAPQHPEEDRGEGRRKPAMR